MGTVEQVVLAAVEVFAFTWTGEKEARRRRAAQIGREYMVEVGLENEC